MGALYRGIGASEQVDKITEWLGGDARDDEEFCGKFVFEFDEEGRIITHTIEHAEENGDLEKTSKVVSVTDWLLGRPWKKRTPELAWSCVSDENGDRRRRKFEEEEREGPRRKGFDVLENQIVRGNRYFRTRSWSCKAETKLQDW